MARAARCPATLRTNLRAVARTSPRCGGTRETLDADIVALQEVDGPDAARLVFHDYRFCFSGRVAVQNNGFAIRRGLPFSCGPELLDLSMNDDVRRGVELRLFPGTPQELRLLSVHLKSGCAREPLESARAGCAVLARQVPVLERWIDAQANEHMPFAVLGDFNRDLRREPAGDRALAGPRRWRPARGRPCQHGRGAELFKTACLRRPSAGSSTTSSWAARWRRDWCQTRSDERFSGQKTRSAESCQITARSLSGFGWQTPSAPCRKSESVKFFAETH